MNGLLAVYTKKELPLPSLEGLLNRGLDMLSHRGGKRTVSFLLKCDSKNGKEGHTRNDEWVENAACLAMGACSNPINTSPTATNNSDILFFDGRLLNKSELFNKLSIESNLSDADTVLHLLRQRGIRCLDVLKGFWSLIWLDAKNKTLYAARDHFGNRPLWYCNTGNQFALASECRTIYSLFDDTRSINRNTVVDYLLWGDIGKLDQYFFKNIHSIEPSHYIKYEIDTDRLSVERYYALPYNRSKDAYQEASEKLYIDKIRARITDSVRANLSLFSGTLAVGVSGGMDSSTLLCLSKKLAPERTFVAYTATDNYDGGEVAWAEKVVRHTGVEWIKVVTKAEDIIERLDELNRIHSAPVFNASSLAQFRVMEEINKQGQTIFIDGQGGDELLGGYPAYFPLFLQSLRKNGEWKQWLKELNQTGNSGITRKEMLTRRLKLWAKAHYYTPLSLAQKMRKEEFESLTPEVRDAYFDHPSPIPLIEKEVLNDALFESYTVFLGNIIRWGEHSAASQGVECVLPLSDDLDLTEFVFSIPSSFKIHNGWNKYLLRRAMAGIVPDEVCHRKQKMGFYFPEQKWLNDIKKPLFDALRNLEDPEECICKGYLNRLYSQENPRYQQFIFRCYSYLLWRNNL